MFYMSAYTYYVRCRSLELSLSATDFDAETVEVLALMRRTLEDLQEQKMKAKRSKYGKSTASSS